jgi:hypothetical protein
MKPSESAENSALLLQCGKTSLALFPQTLDEISQRSSQRFENAGRVTSAGEFWTAGISEWPNDAVECSLSQILEESVPQKYFLSPKACAGVLKRAKKRGKSLPPSLQAALEQGAQEMNEPKLISSLREPLAVALEIGAGRMTPTE